MSDDERCNGYSNWDTFFVGSYLDNVEALYRRQRAVVRAARDACQSPEDYPFAEAGAAMQAEFGDKALYDSTELDMSKVDWEELGFLVLQDLYDDEPDDVELDQALPQPGEHGYVDQLDYPHNQAPES